MGGGGGGGSSRIAVSSSLTSTSSTAGVNAGDGYMTITPIAPLSLLDQYYLNGTSSLLEGSSTNLGGVMFGATLNSSATSTLQLQVEVEPATANFTNVPNVTSSAFVAPGSIATTTFSGPNDSYHWQARQMDSRGTSSPWQIFGPSATSTDFVLASFVTFSYTGAVTSYTVPAHVKKLVLTAYGAQGAAGGGGAQMGGTLSVTPGQVLYLSVGGQNGYGGGANGGVGSGGTFGVGNSGNNGGGMTWIGVTSTFSQTTPPYIVAGGGGGGGGQGYDSIHGGSPGGGGGGGTAKGTAGGAGGTDMWGGRQGSPGSAGQGGNGSFGGGGGNGGAGGGGGGYWGGGGGGSNSVDGPGGFAPASSGAGDGSQGYESSYYGSVGGGGGAGGSSYLSGSLSSTTAVAGINGGDGSAVIFELTDPVPTISSIGQYNSNPIITISSGGSTTRNTVLFHATLNSYIQRNLQLQVEVKPQGTSFTNVPNVTSSVFVAPGKVATTSFTGANGSYHWQARVMNTDNTTSTWSKYSASATSTDFVIAVPQVFFTFPTNGTTTPNFPNWLLNATSVAPATTYKVKVMWSDTSGNPTQSSMINASGTQVISGVNVPKPVFAGDYTYDGTPAVMNATATIANGATVIATTTISFVEQTTVAPLGCGAAQIQCVSYTYDNDGNITKVVDVSATNVAKTVDYVYDSLSRLTSASSSNAANGQNFLQTFSYDPIGNILTKSDTGSYAYNGSTGANYADPDAVTGITNGTSTTSFAYDSNGNLASVSGGSNYSWDYNNRLVGATSTSATLSYGYDHTGQRVKVTNGTSTTYYPETTYNVSGATSTKSIFANGFLVATIQGNTSTSTATSTARSYVSNDYLGGANVVTNASGTLVESLDYYPYGSIRIDSTAGSYAGQQRKFIGQQYDAATSLSYLNARYYNGTQGQFISQDPVFLGNPAQQNLPNPQSLNSYSYAEGNPMTKSDPTGKDAATLALEGGAVLTLPFWTPEVAAAALLAAAVGVSYLATQDIMQIRNTWYRSNQRLQGQNQNDFFNTGGSPNPNTPKWIIGTMAGVSTIGIAEKIWQSTNGQIGSTEDGFNITISNVNSLSSQININNPQPLHSSRNANTHSSSQGSISAQFGGGASGLMGLQIQILQLQVQVLQLQLQISQSTQSTR